MMFRLNQSTSGRRPSRLGAHFARFGKTAGATCLLGLATLTAAQAGIVINVVETDSGGVSIDWAGYLDFTGYTTGSGPLTFTSSPRIVVENQEFIGVFKAQGGSTSFDQYKFSPGTDYSYSVPFDHYTLINANTDASTDNFFYNEFGTIAVPDGYTSGTFISGSATAEGVTFSDGDFTEGSFTTTFGGGGDGKFITMNAVFAANNDSVPALPTDPNAASNSVPAPATPLLIAAGLIGGGLSRRLRRTFA